MKLHKNIYVWYLTTFFSCAAFTLPIWVIFNTEVLGLSNAEAFLLGVLPIGLGAIFEIPMGVLADKFSRVKIYQIGTILYILSAVSYVFFTDFYVLLIFQVLGGLGFAMKSGGLEALVHDSIDDKEKDTVYSIVHGRKMAIAFLSRVIAVLFSGFLYSIDPKLPFVIVAVAYVIELIASLLFKEVMPSSSAVTSHVDHLKETVAFIIKGKALIVLFSLTAIYVFFAEAMFALYQPYFKSIDIQVGEFGLFYAIISIFSAIGALVITTVAKRYNPLKIMLFMMISVWFTVGGMLLEVPMLTYLAIIPSSIAFGCMVTLQNTITQKLIPSAHQATAVSVASFARTAAFSVSVILLGIALDFLSVSGVNLLLVVLTTLFIIPFVTSLLRLNADIKTKSTIQYDGGLR